MKNTLNERNRTVKTIRNYIVSTRIFFSAGGSGILREDGRTSWEGRFM